MFIQARDGALYPIAKITKIFATSRHQSDEKWWAEVGGDFDVEISTEEKSRLEYSPIGTVPAQPDTFIVRVVEDAGSRSIGMTAVVAWFIPRSGPPIPVTLDGVNDGMGWEEAHCIMLPDGSISRYEDRVWTNLQEFKRDFDVVGGVIFLDPDKVPGLQEFVEEALASRE